jgi:hypothetical protein
MTLEHAITLSLIVGESGIGYRHNLAQRAFYLPPKGDWRLAIGNWGRLAAAPPPMLTCCWDCRGWSAAGSTPLARCASSRTRLPRRSASA